MPPSPRNTVRLRPEDAIRILRITRNCVLCFVLYTLTLEALYPLSHKRPTSPIWATFAYQATALSYLLEVFSLYAGALSLSFLLDTVVIRYGVLRLFFRSHSALRDRLRAYGRKLQQKHKTRIEQIDSEADSVVSARGFSLFVFALIVNGAVFNRESPDATSVVGGALQQVAGTIKEHGIILLVVLPCTVLSGMLGGVSGTIDKFNRTCPDEVEQILVEFNNGSDSEGDGLVSSQALDETSDVWIIKTFVGLD